MRIVRSPRSLACAAGLIVLSVSGRAQAEIPNPSFEDGLHGWTASGTAFESQPTLGENVIASRVTEIPLGGDYWRDVVYPIGVRGSRWIGTFERRNHGRTPVGTVQGDEPTGTLTSDPFPLTHPFLSFLVSGGNRPEELRVELWREGALKPLRSATGHGSERFRREVWDLRDELAREAEPGRGRYRLRIVDDSKAAFGHISVDDFREHDHDPRTGSPASLLATEMNSQEVWVDSDAPLWGFIDLHTHPMAQLAFGGRLLHGAIDGDIRDALGNCHCTHGGWGPTNPCGNSVRMAVVSQADADFVHQTALFGLEHDHRGYPYFRAWPNFSSITHQQMWHEWLRRAWQGGLRVIVGLAVNNHLMAEGVDGHLPRDDQASADLQLEELKKFAARHPDFLAIADSPASLREIVQSGRLAIIPGIEVDNLGNFNFADVDASEEAVRTEIRRLYSEGVRYILPIHLTDNAFGGAAITGDLFNVALRFNQAQPLPKDASQWMPGPGFNVETALDDPRINFELKGPLTNENSKAVRSLIRLIEGFPIPVPGLPKPTLGDLWANEREFQVVKRFFLAPFEAPAVPPGHRNAKGLTDLGRVAIDEIMKLGMMLDIDHMSEHSFDDAAEIGTSRLSADGEATGYPLFTGHNSFRALGSELVTENSRTDEQIRRLRPLGGVMGIDYEFPVLEGPGTSASELLDQNLGSRSTISAVEPDCGRSSKAFAQSYLYAIEKFGAVGFGSDTNGLVRAPGPRFGEFSRFRKNYCPAELQKNPVRYFVTRDAHADWAGQNLPLAPLKTGKRVWDINTDGVAHYGMLPDFIQDLRNVGVQPRDLDPLFRGAENLARAWELSIERARTESPSP